MHGWLRDKDIRQSYLSETGLAAAPRSEISEWFGRLVNLQNFMNWPCAAGRCGVS